MKDTNQYLQIFKLTITKKKSEKKMCNNKTIKIKSAHPFCLSHWLYIITSAANWVLQSIQ
jgi:hypothetical protein